MTVKAKALLLLGALASLNLAIWGAKHFYISLAIHPVLKALGS